MRLGEKTLEQIKNYVVGGGTFLVRLPTGGIIARYEAGAPVFLLTRRGMRELPQQSGDLCWLLTSLEEEGISLDPERKEESGPGNG